MIMLSNGSTPLVLQHGAYVRHSSTRLTRPRHTGSELCEKRSLELVPDPDNTPCNIAALHTLLSCVIMFPWRGDDDRHKCLLGRFAPVDVVTDPIFAANSTARTLYQDINLP